MKFICPHCNKETEDTVGGVLVDGFILECSECYETTTIRFEAAQQSVQADVCRVCGQTKEHCEEYLLTGHFRGTRR